MTSSYIVYCSCSATLIYMTGHFLHMMRLAKNPMGILFMRAIFSCWHPYIWNLVSTHRGRLWGHNYNAVPLNYSIRCNALLQCILRATFSKSNLVISPNILCSNQPVNYILFKWILLYMKHVLNLFYYSLDGLKMKECDHSNSWSSKDFCENLDTANVMGV